MTDQPDENLIEMRSPKKIWDEIEAGEKWLRSGHYSGVETRWKQWEKNRKYLMCVWDDEKDDQVNVNTIFSNVNTIRPTLYFRNPKIKPVPSRPTFLRDQYGKEQVDPATGQKILVDNYKAGKLLGVKMNYVNREIKFKRTLKKVLVDCLCPYGVGWIKWGYSTKTSGGRDSNNDRSVNIWGKRVDPRNLVYDWMATDADDSRFFAERLLLTRKEALKMGFKVPKEYTCVLPDFLKDRDSKAKQGGASELLVFWEYHDEVNRAVYWLYDKNQFNGYARDPEPDPYPFDGSSYVPLVMNETNDDIIGLSDVEPVEDQAKAINRLRRKQTQHVDNFGTVTKYEDGAILPNDLDHHVKTPHGVYLKIQPGGTGKVTTEGTPSMGQDNYQMVNEHKEDISTTLGITEYQQGSGGAASATATAANIASNASMIRIQERKDQIKDFVVENMRRLAALIQTYSEEEEFLNLDDEDMDEDFVDVLKKEHGFNPKIPFLHMKREDIQGEFNFDGFDVDDMVQVPKEVQLQQLNGLLQSFMATPYGMAALEANDISLAKAAKKAFELAGVDIGELQHGGPVQIPEEKENQMLLQGMEIPEPHRKDHDDQHIVSHTRVVNELQQKAMGLEQQGQQADQAGSADAQALAAIGSSGDAAPVDPSQSDAIRQQQQDSQMQLAQQQAELQLQLMPLKNMIRRAQLHIQEHEEKRQRKEQASAGIKSSMPQAPQGAPQSAASIQSQMQGQANQGMQ